MNHDTNRAGPNFDDPLLTAYALGELEGPEAAEFERRLATDSGLREELAAIRSVGASLREGFAAEPVTTLTELQRARIMRPPAASVAGAETASRAALNSPRVFLLRSRWIGASLAAAAVLALTVTAAILYNRGVASSGNVALQRPGARGDHGPSSAKDEFETRAPMPRSATASGENESLSKKNESAESALKMPAPGQAPEPLTGRVSGDASGLADESAAPSVAIPPAAAAGANAPTPAAPTPAPTSAAPGPAGAATGGTGGVESRGSAVPPASARPEATRERERARATDKAPAAPKPAARSEPQQPAREPEDKAPVLRDSPQRPAERAAAGAEGDRDDRAPTVGATGGLRQPVDEALSRAQTLDPLTEEAITHLEAGDARRALEETERQRDNTEVDSLRRQLFRQAERLRQRLREIEVRDAEEYSRINDNPFIKPVGVEALSTFAADVDTASYSNIRRFLEAGLLPPADAVRIEEMVNYFRYDYDAPTAADGDAPFKANVEIAPAPWNPAHRLVRVGLRGKEVRLDMRPATNLVFLIDVSASMDDPAKLPLVKHALNLLVRQLHGDDRLAIVTYQGNAGLVLDSCYVNAENRARIDAAIETMTPGGSTNGAGGINLAYDVARRNFIKGGVNRVILCTDGDFNVGASSDEALVQLIQEQRTSNVYLSVLGFGTGNLKESKMEKLADAGNGNFAYIDSLDEARKVLVEQAGGTLVAIAKDVKFQIEFNPAKVGAYRLIGYENRLLAAEDFNDDAKDAGEIGSGHMMTALYEIAPPGATIQTSETRAAEAPGAPADGLDEFKFQKPAAAAEPWSVVASDDLAELRIRYKQPDQDKAQPTLRIPIKDEAKALNDTGDDFRFAAAVAEFGMLLRRSPHKSGATFEHVLAQAEGALGADHDGYRAQFMNLVRTAQRLESGD